MAYVVVEVVDHISRLPAAIIHHIFSFLPFKDVVKTSVLSKQWRFAWASTPYIHLSLPSAGVVPLISRALSRCTATKIEKFHLDATKSGNDVLIDPDWWIRFAVAGKVKHASFVFGSFKQDVPRFLCSCASLRSHPSLGTCDLRIDSRSLRELVIENVYILSLDVSAPNLLSLRLSGMFVPPGFRLNGASSLAEAELNFDKPTNFRGCFLERMKFVLEQLQHIAKITMGSWCLKVLSAVEVMGMSYLSSRWRNIIVYTTFSKSNHLGMAYVLKSSPRLERLVICNPKSDNITFDNKDYPELCDFDEKQFWHSQKEFYCVANHLKRVEIVGFEFDNEKSKLLLDLAKFFLEEAVGLEKMIIDVELKMSRRGVPMDPHDLWGIQVVIQLQEGCRRASRNAEVIVNYFNGLPTKA
ncbi:F-box protein At5g03100-like isoform X2 [Syzygium oleosum]|uniref:F-box protein At5g03100-like isoform X2 n=1 Tax=Syzygium oleosum TaxID=219896 RepID=UPI0024BBD400|nr:F-box protein At5g03100-like isoform X2 [Syzygium oleosum]